MASKSTRTVSRRKVLKTAAAAVAAGGAALRAGDAAAQAQGAPAIITNTQAGRRSRAYLKYSTNPASVEQITLRALSGRQVAIRTEAVQCCYTEVDAALVPGRPAQRANTLGHGQVGYIEAVGPQAIRVQVGDRVLVTQHAQCGRCYNCLRLRGDKCMNTGNAEAQPFADMGGTPVWGALGGMTEIAVVNEEHAIPIFTDLPATQLSNLTCVTAAGLGMTMTLAPVDVASDVVVFGAGLVGLSAIQGARIKGAAQIIAVEPIKYRRDLALQVGAHIALDPNLYKGDDLVHRIQDLCRHRIAKTERRWAGGGNFGPDHVIEAVGGDRLPPKEVAGPDPTGVEVLQQCWMLGSQIGSIVTCSVGQPPDAKVKFQAAEWADGYKHHLPGTYGGTNPRRDMPRYVRLMETGMFNMKALDPTAFPIERATDAYQAAADRTVIGSAVVFSDGIYPNAAGRVPASTI
jgi:S-(hydroxymethyl)glutathione dehydrogenase/alcohol dehydrogenase